MKKPFLADKNYKKNFWCVFLVSLVISLIVIYGHYSSLHTANSTAAFFVTYTNLEIYSNEIKGNISGSITPFLITKGKRNPLHNGKENSEIVSKQISDQKSRFKKKKADQLDSCLGRYIYIHNLPSRFNMDIMKDCSLLNKWFDMCESLLNNGLGPQTLNSYFILQNNSWFVTNQFTLEIIFHSRMKQYKCLTNDSSLASAMYVPFYAGLDVGRYLWDGFSTTVRDFASVDLAKWLSEMPEWKKMWGRDHFFVAGRITWDFRRLTDNEIDWGNKLMTLPEAKNMTMLTIESSPWSNTDFAIPYPTYFHPSGDSEVIDWQNRMRRQKRGYLFSFVGAPRPNLENSVRAEIIKQCLASNENCKLLDCNSNAKACYDPAHVMKLLQHSTFCLQPPGDSYTRRSTFDSILAGCIPVFFHPGTAYIQYLWHLPKNYAQYSVFIPQYAIKDGKENIESILRDFSEEKMLAMREEVIRLIPKIIYADPRTRLESFEDAFDIAVEKVLERVEEIRKEMKHGSRSNFSFSEEFSWKYYSSGTMKEHEWDPFFTKP